MHKYIIYKIVNIKTQGTFCVSSSKFALMKTYFEYKPVHRRNSLYLMYMCVCGDDVNRLHLYTIRCLAYFSNVHLA